MTVVPDAAVRPLVENTMEKGRRFTSQKAELDGQTPGFINEK